MASASAPEGFRAPTRREVEELFPKASRGWANQAEEHSFWVEPAAIEGRVPEGLQGTYLRNGPGMTNVYGTPLKHPIDGDGMVVAISFFEGRVHFQNRFVQTQSHKEEAAAHKMLYNGNMGSRAPKAVSRRPRDPAHTNVFYWGGKLLACYEYAYPHALDPRTLETLGPDTLGGHFESTKAVSAHFRLDVERNLLVAIGFKAGVLGGEPSLSVVEFDRAWNAVQDLDLSIPGLNYVHDFLMTPDYFIFHVTPFVDTSEKAVQLIFNEGKAPGEILAYDPSLPSQMVVVERHPAAGSERRRWHLETEPCHIYHFQNAVQHGGDKVTFGATCLPPGFNMQWQHKVFLSNTAEAPGLYYDYAIDLTAGTCKRSLSPKVARISNEFPTSNPYRQCVRTGDSNATKSIPPRFVYLMGTEPGVTMPFTRIVKYDPHGDQDAVWVSPGIVGEPVYVPRHGHASAFFGDDDDGWVITQMYLPDEQRVKYVILDARNLAAGPVCSIDPGFHVPFSFHGTWTESVFQVPDPKL